MNVPARKRQRLKKYDYSTPGYYHIVIRTAPKVVLGSVKTVGDAAHGVPSIQLSAFGQIVLEKIMSMAGAYDNASVDTYIIMPDHVHLLLEIQAMTGGTPGASSPTDIPKIVNSFKTLTSKLAGVTLWQRGYYDHIIRGDADLAQTRDYITQNLTKRELI